MNDDDGDGKYEFVLPFPTPIVKTEFAINFLKNSGFNDIEIEYCSKRMYCFIHLHSLNILFHFIFHKKMTELCFHCS